MSIDRETVGDEGQFAAVVPVACTPLGLWRGVELIRSLVFWEPQIRWFVLLMDSLRFQGLSDLSIFPPTSQVNILTNPLSGLGRHWVGGLTTGILRALSWVHERTAADFVLRIDTDALVIGPFATAIRSLMAREPAAGVIGAIGSCNPDVRARRDTQQEPRLLRALKRWPPAPVMPDGGAHGESEREGPLGITIEERRCFDEIRSHVSAAVAHGYATSEDCQGGALVLTRTMIDRMAAAGYLENEAVWRGLPFQDDQVLAMYARAVQLRLQDFSAPGESFGVQATGLGYSPAELVARGYSIVHSVKDNRRFPLDRETVIRQYFRDRTARIRHRPT